MKTAIIGGGAAGFFLAINLKERMPEMQVTIFERSRRVLSKVEISGGGRCNCTNSFASVFFQPNEQRKGETQNGPIKWNATDLKQVYPRGHRLMKRLMHEFDHRAAYEWFERHGVELVTQEDECVFPASQDSHTIINCFLREASRLGVAVRTEQRINSLDELAGFDFVCVTTGGSPRREGLAWLESLGHKVETPCPSLFTFNIEDEALRELMGTVVETATVQIPGTKFRASGPLLLTHWGMSGPAILKLSSYAARHLAERNYQETVSVNWLSQNEEQVRSELTSFAQSHAGQLVAKNFPYHAVQGRGFSSRLWLYLVEKVGLGISRWADTLPLSAGRSRGLNRLTNVLTNDCYTIAGRGVNKEEFVTCGGISLSSVNPSTLESRVYPQSQGKLSPRLFFAGEVLDIDGITGGFNFQAAWTTAYVVAKTISDSYYVESQAFKISQK